MSNCLLILIKSRVTCHHLSGKPGNVRNLTAVREMSGILLKIRELSGKNVVREKLPKTVYCKLHICVHAGI